MKVLSKKDLAEELEQLLGSTVSESTAIMWVSSVYALFAKYGEIKALPEAFSQRLLPIVNIDGHKVYSLPAHESFETALKCEKTLLKEVIELYKIQK